MRPFEKSFTAFNFSQIGLLILLASVSYQLKSDNWQPILEHTHAVLQTLSKTTVPKLNRSWLLANMNQALPAYPSEPSFMEQHGNLPLLPQMMSALLLTAYKHPYTLAHSLSLPLSIRQSTSEDVGPGNGNDVLVASTVAYTDLNPDEILIKTAAAGYCHGDLMIQNLELGAEAGELPIGGTGLPMIPFHEGAGIVVRVGSGINPEYLKIGDRVGVMASKDPCGTCTDCTKGYQNYCANLKLRGITINGTASEYILADAWSAIKLPDGIGFDAGAGLMCAGSTVYSGLKKAGVKRGQVVAIIGIGGLGHLGVQFAKCLGCCVVAVDVRQAPLDLIQKAKFPPDVCINSSQISHEELDSYLAQNGIENVDTSIVVADSNAAFDLALKLTGKHGTVVGIGIPQDVINVHYNHLIFRNLTLKSATLGTPAQTREMLALVAEHGIEVQTRTYDLNEFERMLKDYQSDSRAGKYVLKMNGLLH